MMEIKSKKKALKRLHNNPEGQNLDFVNRIHNLNKILEVVSDNYTKIPSIICLKLNIILLVMQIAMKITTMVVTMMTFLCFPI